MTMPDERYRSVTHTRMFLHELLNPHVTPRVPKSVRQTASQLLRHYPSELELDRAARAAPDIFAKNLEDVTRFFMKYEQGKKDAT